jgi:spore coat polysaccharide biosynthesis predicted glycosyltransferase SpsG
MGIETVAAVVGIASAAKNLMSSSHHSSSGMSYADANAEARAQLNPQYDSRMKDVLKNVQNNLISRGFNGQQAGTELSTETAAENERQRIAAISGLTTQLQQNSAATALEENKVNAYKQNSALNGLMQGADWWSKQYTVPGSSGSSGGSYNTFYPGSSYDIPKPTPINQYPDIINPQLTW